MKGTEIQDSILVGFYKSKPLAITNYSGITGYEGDVMMVSPSGFVTEYEVKTSRADFKKDFSKVSKHNRLKKPNAPSKSWGYPYAPNYFYYVCIDGLIKKDEVPAYAGLIYIVGGIPVIIIKAKRLHNHKITQPLKDRIGRTLSLRTIFGSSYLRHKHK